MKCVLLGSFGKTQNSASQAFPYQPSLPPCEFFLASYTENWPQEYDLII